MDKAEKLRFVQDFCHRNKCGECELRRPHKWEHPSLISCLEYAVATEDELDEAIKIITEAENEAIKPENDVIKNDNVEHPSHYTTGGIECIDAIKASMSSEEYKGFLKSQVIKYVWRYRLKGKPVEDLKKARFYLERLIIETEGAEK